MSAIEFNYQQAIAKAQELDEVSSSLKNLSNSNITNTFSALKSSWEGTSSNTFVQKGSQLCEKVVTKATSCESIADHIRTVAEAIRAAEEAAEEAARRRDY